VIVQECLLPPPQLKSFDDVADAGKSASQRLLDQAKAEAKEAQLEASAALATSQTVKQDVDETQRRLKEIGASVHTSSDQVGKINKNVTDQQLKLAALSAATDTQTKAVTGLTQQVQEIEASQIEQQVGNIRPEFGSSLCREPIGSTRI